jgi:hypothetical protein
MVVYPPLSWKNWESILGGPVAMGLMVGASLWVVCLNGWWNRKLTEASKVNQEFETLPSRSPTTQNSIVPTDL